MRDYFSRLLRGQFGFSMVQAILGLSVVAGLGLVVAQISKQASQGHKATVSNYSVIELTAQIQSLLAQSNACFESLKSPSPLAINQTRPVGTIFKSSGVPALITGQSYANNEIRIVNMALQRRAENSLFTVIMRRNATQGNKASVSSDIRKEFLINTEWNASGVLTGCASDISNYIETVVELTIAKVCMSGGVLLGPDDPNAPTECRALAQLGEDPTSLRCNPGQTYSGLVWDTTLNRYRMECKSLIQVDNCESDELMRREPDGRITCIKVSCPPNAVSTGLRSGVMGCVACGVGETLIMTGNGPECRTISCTPGSYLKGIQSDGSALCLPLIASNDMCTGSSRLIEESGSIRVECCTPNCSNASNYCEGTTNPSANGCGTCVGTRQPDCSNASNYCIGTTNTSANGCGSCPGTKLPDCSNAANYCVGTTFSSSNGCGVCTGAKPKVDGVGSWTTTTETRNVGTCQNGIQKTEKKEIKICTIATCGGTPCVPEERWVAGPNKSCSSGNLCTTVYRCHLGKMSSGECLEGGVLGAETSPVTSPACEGREERSLAEQCKEICGGGSSCLPDNTRCSYSIIPGIESCSSCCNAPQASPGLDSCCYPAGWGVDLNCGGDYPAFRQITNGVQRQSCYPGSYNPSYECDI